MDPVDGGHTETTVKRQTQKESSLAQSFRGKNKNKMRRKCSRCVRTCVSWVWLCVCVCVCVCVFLLSPPLLLKQKQHIPLLTPLFPLPARPAIPNREESTRK